MLCRMDDCCCERSTRSKSAREICVLLFISLLPAAAQAPGGRLKPTEAVIKRYEKLILRGALVSPEGWKLASSFFVKPEPYPQNSEIHVEWAGTSVLGEEWNNGSRAQVNTKWNDFYGTIDSNLHFEPIDRNFTTMPMAESFTLVFVPQPADGLNKRKPSVMGQGTWKIDSPLNTRIASISFAIKYLEKMRHESSDPTLRNNAEKSIDTLKRFRSGCGVPNPC